MKLPQDRSDMVLALHAVWKVRNDREAIMCDEKVIVMMLYTLLYRVDTHCPAMT